MRGYTMIEILVVVAITAFLSSIVIVYSSAGRQQVALSVEAAKVGQVISRAKALAISTHTTAPGTCGYGVSFDYAARQYSLATFASANCRSLAAMPAMTPIETHALPSTVAFGAGANRIDAVLFVPPDPRVYLNVGGAFGGNQNGTVYLQTADGQASRTVTVGGGGQISF